jgi:hypothetical protein
MIINRKSPVRALLPGDVKEAARKKAAPAKTSKYMSDDALHQLWGDHRATPSTDFRARNRIIKEVGGFINQAIKPYKSHPSPYSEKEGKALSTVVTAIENWDPNRENGAPLRSFIHKSLFPIAGNTNVSVVGTVLGTHGGDLRRLSGDRKKTIDKARELTYDFKNEKGRPPTPQELAGMLSVSVDEARKMQFDLRGVYNASSQIDMDSLSVGTIPPQVWDAIHTVHASLRGADKKLMGWLFYPRLGGTNPPKDQNDMGTELNMTAQVVSQRKKRIRGLINDLL